jgi:hypothetical protein
VGGDELVGVSAGEFQALLRSCSVLKPARGKYRQTDFITNLFLIVLDYRSTPEGVYKALDHYKRRLWDHIRTMEDLEGFLARYPDTPLGNLEAGAQLWGFRAERRLRELRGIVKYFRSKGVVNQQELVRWAKNSTWRDFMGQVRGLSLQVYEAILVRQGLGALKPAPHLSDFVASSIGRSLPDDDVVEVVTRAAQNLGLPPRELERRIYEKVKLP